METKLQQEINNVLKEFPEYWNENTLLKNKLIEDIRLYNEKIIEAFLSNELIRDTYSLQLKSGAIFKVEDFISMLRFKNYWDNSYTKYSNEIGLTSEDKYLKYNTDVVLDFPHKDGVLEGGMSEEDIGKREIYYHNIIAKEEIDTLLSPKVLSSAIKYDKDGEHSITHINETDNLILKGNNLIALYSLKERYQSKVKFIYIDPSYNTGNDGFKYNDRFNHSTWLTFMKNRLEIAQYLLKDDGVICVQINDNEAGYLNVLMDELFGREAYLTTQYIRVRYPDKTLKQDSTFHKEIEQIFIYKKNKDSTVIPNLKESDYAYEKFKYSIKTKSPSSTITLGNKTVDIFEKGSYEIVAREGNKDGLKEIWATGTVLNGNSSGRFFRDYLDGRYKEDGYGVLYKVWGIGEDQFDYRFFTGPKKEGATKGKYYQGVPLEILNNPNSKQTKPIEGFMDLAGAFGNNRHEGGVSFGSGKKPEILIQSLLSYFTNKEDVILDFFMGSGTTLSVAHKMNRKYIGIEQMEYIQEYALPRLQKVVSGDSTGVSKSESWSNGGSFIYAELHSLNFAFINDIQKAEDDDSLNNILENIKKSSYLNFKVDLEKITSHDEGYCELSLKEKKDALIQTLDMNQLYLNYSEIEDSQYEISDSVKSFNHSFYQKEGDQDE